mgnify:CR=1 FL=1
MSNTSMTIRMNEDVKKQTQRIFSDLGLDMTTAINIFLRQTILHNGLPFDVSLNEPNRATLAAMDDIEHRRNIAGPFHSVDDLMRDLNA